MTAAGDKSGNRNAAGALRVGTVIDERFLEHKTGHGHPEHPRRLAEIHRMMESTFKDRLSVIRAEPATVEQVEMVHTPGHVRRILKTAEQRISSMAPDTQVSARTYMAAWLAAGACIRGVDMLMAPSVDAFFALVRPPGHHALADKAGGFCIFNNIAIAARHAMKTHGLRRILVVDWDIHHGNGINDLFYKDNKVYYYSTHDPGLYPYSGYVTETGEGEGLGYTMNIGLVREMTDDDMIRLYEQTLRPAIKGYDPEMIMVAAGFDAHTDDPVGKSAFSENLYGRITRGIIEWSEKPGGSRPPLFFALEGGYDPRALTRSVASVFEALCTPGETERPEAPETPPEHVASLVRAVIDTHLPYGIITT